VLSLSEEIAELVDEAIDDIAEEVGNDDARRVGLALTELAGSLSGGGTQTYGEAASPMM
jgi:hypothetical protein